jgi:hypothetical protein
LSGSGKGGFYPVKIKNNAPVIDIIPNRYLKLRWKYEYFKRAYNFSLAQNFSYEL